MIIFQSGLVLGLLSGNISYVRFSLAGSMPNPEQAVEKLNLFRFRPLHEHGEDNETAGWVSFLKEYETQKPLEYKDVFFDGNVVLCLRLDVIKIPKPLLKANVKKSWDLYFVEHKRFPDKVIKKELEMAEAKALRARILPHTKIVEAFVDLHRKEVRVLTRTKALIDRFRELFEQSFMVHLNRDDFVAVGLKNEAKAGALDNLHHEPLYSSTMVQ